MCFQYIYIFFSGPFDETVTEQIQWLKNSIEPWSRVREYWESTCGRREDLTSIDEYLTTYPALKQPYGYALVIYIIYIH